MRHHPMTVSPFLAQTARPADTIEQDSDTIVGAGLAVDACNLCINSALLWSRSTPPILSFLAFQQIQTNLCAVLTLFARLRIPPRL